MTRILEIIVILFLSLFSFFLGVKYSRTIKEHASWMFENKGDEVELPDLSNTENLEMDAPVDENGKPIDQTIPPAEDQNIVPSIDDTDAAPTPGTAPINDNNVAQPTAPQSEPVVAPESTTQVAQPTSQAANQIHKKKKKKRVQQ